MNKRILIVDDEKEICESIESFLEIEKIPCLSAYDYNEACFKCDNEAFSCIVLDYKIGKKTAADFIQRIRNPNNLNARTPIILISGHLTKDMLRQIASEVSSALMKPFNVAKLVELIIQKKASPLKSKEEASLNSR